MIEMSNLESTITIPASILFYDVDGEAVLLNQKDGKYYGFDAVGTRMWTILSEQKQLRAAHKILLAEYDVSAEQLEHDLVAFVDEMAAHGLVQVNET
jgi:hypothetical protein